MADIKQITIDNITYNIKDETARSSIATEETARQNADSTLSTQITNEATARQNADTSLSNQITALQASVGSPLVASTVSAMTDTTKIYVYTGSETGYTNGNWYYYNGSSWVSGGVYNSVAVATDKTLSVSDMPADAKKVGDDINYVENDLYNISSNLFDWSTLGDSTYPTGWRRGYFQADGTTNVHAHYIRTYTRLPIDDVKKFVFTPPTGCRGSVVTFDDNGTFVSRSAWSNDSVSIDTIENYRYFFHITDVDYASDGEIISEFTDTILLYPYDYESKIDVQAKSLNTIQRNIIPLIYEEYDNVFDGYYEVGGISSTTGLDTDSTSFCRTDYIPVNAGDIIYDKSGGYIDDLGYGFHIYNWYDSDKNFLRRNNLAKSSGTYSSDATLGGVANYTAPSDGYVRLAGNYNRVAGQEEKLCVFKASALPASMGEVPAYSKNLNLNHKHIKAKLVELENYVDLPLYTPTEYAISEATEIAETLKTLQETYPKSLSFGFVTDLHYNYQLGEATTISKDIAGSLKIISENVVLPFIFFGGDNVAEKQNHTNQITNLSTLKNLLNSFGIKYGCVKGNHDDSSISGYDSEADKYQVGYNVTDLEQYARLWKHNENSWNIHMDSNRDKLYFYVDFPSQQTRVICLNCVDIPYINDNGYLRYDGQHQYGYSNEQLNWVINNALNFDNVENPDDWSVITIQHITDNPNISSFSSACVQDAHNGSVMYNIFKAFNDKSAYSFTRTSSDFDCSVSCDFTSAQQNLICRISGHTHADRYVVYDNILYISTMQAGVDAVGNSTASDGNTYTKTSGTADETAFDIFTIDKDSEKVFATRYGAGISREFDF